MQYDAFISYSHTTDERLALALRNGLHQLAKPWYKRRALRVFLDQSGMGATPGLWDSLQKALDQSRFLVVLLSKESAESHWVNREIQHWLAHRSVSKMLLVMSQGVWSWDESCSDFGIDQSESIPPALRGVFSEEPGFIDLRWVSVNTDLHFRNPQFRNAVADLAAPMHGVDRDLIDGEDVRQHQRAQRIRRVTVSALVLLTILALAAGYRAIQNARVAEHRAIESKAQALAAIAKTFVEQRTDLSLLLGLESLRLDPTGDGWGALLTGLTQRVISLAPIQEHQWPVTTLVSSADGSILASADNQGNVYLWDPLAGKRLVGPLRIHQQPIWDIAFSPDGSHIATASNDKTVKVWSVSAALTSGNSPTVKLISHESPVISIAYSPEGASIATGTFDGKLQLWNLEHPSVATELESPYTQEIIALAFLPGKRTLVAGGSDGRLFVWDLTHQPSTPELLGKHEDWVKSFAFHPLGKILLTVGYDREVRFWNMANRSTMGSLDGGSGLQDITIHPDGSLFAIARIDGFVTIKEMHSGNTLASLSGHSNSVESVQFIPGSNLLVSAGDDAIIRRWSLLGRAMEERYLTVENAKLLTVEFSPQGSLVASAGSDMTVRIWNYQDGKPEGAPLRGQTGTIFDISFAKDGTLLAAGGAEGSVHVWQISRESPIYELALKLDHGGIVFAVEFSPDSKQLASAGDSGHISLWDPKTGERIGTLSNSESPQQDLDFSPDGRRLASVSRDGHVKIWQLEQGKLVSEFSYHGGLLGAAFDPSGQLLATGSADGTVQIWHVDTGRAVWSVPARHNAEATDVAFSQDGFILASVGWDGTIRLWNARTGVAMGEPISAHADFIWAVAFSPTGEHFATASEDGRVGIWAGPQIWKSLTCKLAARSLTASEWAEFVGDAHPYDQRDCKP